MTMTIPSNVLSLACEGVKTIRFEEVVMVMVNGHGQRSHLIFNKYIT